jgi:peptidoglycan/xylan/chitin deacetylase (PgdA/CDA1 family)
MRTPILCYHKVGPASEEGRRLNVEPARLASHAAFFARRGYRFVLARELAEDWYGRQVCFSFDDAYVSAATYGAEALERAGARGTFYAVTSLVGKASDWDEDAARPLADLELLKALVGRGHEIGNHTATHVHLDRESTERQRSEIVDAHEWLVGAGLAPASFCFPYGGLTSETPALVASVGYRVGLSLRKGVSTDGDDRTVLPRVVVAYSDSLPSLLYKLTLRPLLRRIGV